MRLIERTQISTHNEKLHPNVSSFMFAAAGSLENTQKAMCPLTLKVGGHRLIARELSDQANLLSDVDKSLEEGLNVLVGLTTNKLQPKIELDRDNWYVPREKDGLLKFLYIRGKLVKDGKIEGLYVQNSEGNKFGIDGAFKIKAQDFLTDVKYILTLKNVPSNSGL